MSTPEKRNPPDPQAADTAQLTTGKNTGNHRRASLIIIPLVCLGFTYLLNAAELDCPRGKLVTADLGEGVTMRTCMWVKESNVMIRTGPLELIKNGTTILRTQTDADGKLQGRFTSWSDAGEIIQNGLYSNGLKHGAWLETDKHGNSKTQHYQNGILIEP